MRWQKEHQRLALVLDGPVTIIETQGMDFHAVKPPEGSSESLKPRLSSTESCNCGGGRWLCLAAVRAVLSAAALTVVSRQAAGDKVNASRLFLRSCQNLAF